mmetsp:Transcript_16734/g.50750  ORF Transcript_16734/g.50750 Transcript_16734/m.50750 type:complete len:225 (-) Transcript_16734:86-760(-)|eukprot:scaffold99889_cov29-Tisochrysis_lutea.AAC.6
MQLRLDLLTVLCLPPRPKPRKVGIRPGARIRAMQLEEVAIPELDLRAAEEEGLLALPQVGLRGCGDGSEEETLGATCCGPVFGQAAAANSLRVRHPDGAHALVQPGGRALRKARHEELRQDGGALLIRERHEAVEVGVWRRRPGVQDVGRERKPPLPALRLVIGHLDQLWQFRSLREAAAVPGARHQLCDRRVGSRKPVAELIHHHADQVSVEAMPRARGGRAH